MSKLQRALIVAAFGCLLGVLAAGCGGGSGDSTSAPATTTTNGSTTEGTTALTEAKSALAAALKGTYKSPPSSGPSAEAGKKVWVISCGQSAVGCASPSEAAMEAGKEMGWDMTLFDGKLNPTGYSEGINQALGTGAEGIITVAIDCPLIKGALEKAKKQQVPVVNGASAFDCSDPVYGEEAALFAATPNLGQSYGEFTEELGRAKADYAIAETEGKAKVISIVGPDFAAAVAENKGYTAEMKKCSGCEIVETLEIPATQLTGEAQQRVRTALSQHPEANVVDVPYDAMTLALAQALSANAKDLLVVGVEGFEPNMELIREGVQSAATAVDTTWEGWAAADTMNRVFAGETKMPVSGVGFQLVDSTNVPKTGPFVAPVEFKAPYLKVWKGEAEG